MNIYFYVAAEAEFDDAVEYYDRQAPGLGRQFRQAVRDALKRIQQFPMPIRRSVAGRADVLSVVSPMESSIGTTRKALRLSLWRIYIESRTVKRRGVDLRNAKRWRDAAIIDGAPDDLKSWTSAWSASESAGRA